MESFQEKVVLILKLKKPVTAQLETLIEQQTAEKQAALEKFAHATGGMQTLADLLEALKKTGFDDAQIVVGPPRRDNFTTAVVWDFYNDAQATHLCRAIILEIFDPETKRARINGVDLNNLTGQELADKPRIAEEILRAVREPKIINVNSHQFIWIKQASPTIRL